MNPAYDWFAVGYGLGFLTAVLFVIFDRRGGAE